MILHKIPRKTQVVTQCVRAVEGLLYQYDGMTIAYTYSNFWLMKKEPK